MAFPFPSWTRAWYQGATLCLRLLSIQQSGKLPAHLQQALNEVNQLVKLRNNSIVILTSLHYFTAQIEIKSKSKIGQHLKSEDVIVK